ncbi:pentatricopeptide repeat-containing protein At4g39952, mitochondrial [Silene latifolia]|uniref:pentatricopeptide repeat-containing protein At4g39952, mitochondrial n=1 Tax=Silene latifolia TaxID=37657 RepID=UPI003D786EF6
MMKIVKTRMSIVLKLKPSSPLLLFRRSSSSSSSYYINSHLNWFLSNHHSLNLSSLLESHAFIILTGNHNNLFFASKLISRYSSLFKPHFSTLVFNSLLHKDPFLWNSLIQAHFYNSLFPHSLHFFRLMRLSNTPPTHFTIPIVVTASVNLESFHYGLTIHALALKFGLLHRNSAVPSSFIYFYSKSRSMLDARKMFDEMRLRDVVAWTALLIGYLQNGQSHASLECFCLMHRTREYSERPNNRSLEGGFQACANLGALPQGKSLHAFAIKTGYVYFHGVQSSVFSMYSKWGTLAESCYSFSQLGNKDLICWTSIIAAFAKSGFVTKCLSLFWQMQDAGICPDQIVIACVLSSFGDPIWVREGKAFHGLIMRTTSLLDQVVQRALISMYCKFGRLAIAERIFDTLEEKNSETWNLMVCEYGKAGVGRKCLLLFREMLHRRIECDFNILISVITSCTQLGILHLGKSVHCYVIKNLLDDNVSLSNSLLDMYGKCGGLAIAMSIFGRIQRDKVTWNTLISAFVHKGEFAEALVAFDEMIVEGASPDTSTLVTVLSACSRLASVEHGMKIHNYVNSVGIELTISLKTALIDMYGKCGHLETSREIFDSMKERDVISWNVMISCYGLHGDARSAIEVFEKMEECNSIRPNELTFLALLLACSHAGLTKEAKYFLNKMQDYSMKPTIKHYTCIVDLLGKSGNLQEAEDVVMSMPVTPDGGLWGALLSACKLHNEVEIGKRIASLAIEADPENDGYYIALSNMLDSTGEWKEAEKFRAIMKEKGVRKRLGWSTL